MDRDFIKEFLTYIQVEKGLARHTLESYRRDLDRLQSWANTNKKQITELTRSDLRKWIASLSREGLAPTSIARISNRKTPRERGFCEAAGLGFEPRLLGPEPSVLPLDDPATAVAAREV